MADPPPKLRSAINQFVLAYNPHTHVLIEYTPTQHAEHFRLSRCDGAWQLVADQMFPNLKRAIEVAERFFDTPRQGWVLVSDEIEKWQSPAAVSYESRRLLALGELRTLLSPNSQ